MKKKYLILIYLVLLVSNLMAQQYPVYNQFFLNPYFYNPAYAGTSDRIAFFLTHRRQWVAVDGAPVTTNLSFHLPRDGKFAYAANVYNDQRGVLSTTTVKASMSAYAELGTEHYLGVGFSFGAGSNSVDWKQLDAAIYGNDETLYKALDNRIYLDGSLGIRYQYRQLRLGISMPDMLHGDQLDLNQYKETGFNGTQLYAMNGSYRFEWNEFAVEPHVLYRHAKGLPGQVEALAIGYWQDKVWLGGGYRQGYSPVFLLGFKPIAAMQVGYSYEVASRQVSKLPEGTHELFISYRTGTVRSRGIKSSVNTVRKK